MRQFIEQDCKIELQGKEYESGGAYIALCTDGKMRGVVYVNSEKRIVTTWHGEFIARMSYTDYNGNFCKMRRVSFTLDGVKYVGDYCPDWADACRVRSTKPVK